MDRIINQKQIDLINKLYPKTLDNIVLRLHKFREYRDIIESSVGFAVVNCVIKSKNVDDYFALAYSYAVKQVQGDLSHIWRTKKRKPIINVSEEIYSQVVFEEIDEDIEIEKFEKLIGPLRNIDREILRLSFLDDLPLDLIAIRLNCTYETIKRRRLMALRRLRELLEEKNASI